MAIMAAYTDSGQVQGKAQPTTEAEDPSYWTLHKLKQAYLDYLWLKRAEIDEQQNSRRYRHGSQWTSAQVEVFNARKQPVVTYNRVGRKIDAIVGLLEKLKQDPKAFPRTPQGGDGADLATAIVRYVIDSQLRQVCFPYCTENGATDGIGCVEMQLVKGDKGDRDVGFNRVQPDGFFYDPKSFEHDFSDARYMGYAKWMDVDDAVSLAPEKEEEIRFQMASDSELTTNPDRDKNWFGVEQPSGRRRVRVVDLWYRHRGGWCWCLFTGTTKLIEGYSYFFDEKGDPICKFIAFSAFIDQDGDRYGFVRGLKSSQDEINQRRSKGLHELNSRRIKAEDGAFTDPEKTRREAVRPDGMVIYNKGFEMEFDDQARIMNMEGQLKFLEDAKNEIENFGPNPALIGQGLEYKSGRAISLLQQAGIAELGPFVINYKNWKLRLYRAIWAAVQKYWTGERWVRVTGNQDVAQFVQVNGVGIDPQTGFPKLVNALGQLDVNFIMDEGPDEVNMMADAYDTLTALATQGAQIPPQVMLELAPLNNDVKKRLIGMVQQAQQPDPMKQQVQQLMLQGEAAKIQETQSKTALNQATAQEKAQGGAHGMIERVFDAQQKQQEFRMKMAEGQQKIGLEHLKSRTKMMGDLANLHMTAMSHGQQMQHDEAAHQQSMMHEAQMAAIRRQTAARPMGGLGG